VSLSPTNGKGIMLVVKMFILTNKQKGIFMSAQREKWKILFMLGCLLFWSQDLVLQKSNCLHVVGKILRIFGTFWIPVLIVEEMDFIIFPIYIENTFIKIRF
jgi:hypothetical protein